MGTSHIAQQFEDDFADELDKFKINVISEKMTLKEGLKKLIREYNQRRNNE